MTFVRKQYIWGGYNHPSLLTLWLQHISIWRENISFRDHSKNQVSGQHICNQHWQNVYETWNTVFEWPGSRTTNEFLAFCVMQFFDIEQFTSVFAERDVWNIILQMSQFSSDKLWHTKNRSVEKAIDKNGQSKQSQKHQTFRQVLSPSPVRCISPKRLRWVFAGGRIFYHQRHNTSENYLTTTSNFGLGSIPDKAEV